MVHAGVNLHSQTRVPFSAESRILPVGLSSRVDVGNGTVSPLFEGDEENMLLNFDFAIP